MIDRSAIISFLEHLQDRYSSSTELFDSSREFLLPIFTFDLHTRVLNLYIYIGNDHRLEKLYIREIIEEEDEVLMKRYSTERKQGHRRLWFRLVEGNYSETFESRVMCAQAFCK